MLAIADEIESDICGGCRGGTVNFATHIKWYSNSRTTIPALNFPLRSSSPRLVEYILVVGHEKHLVQVDDQWVQDPMAPPPAMAPPEPVHYKKGYRRNKHGKQVPKRAQQRNTTKTEGSSPNDSTGSQAVAAAETALTGKATHAPETAEVTPMSFFDSTDGISSPEQATSVDDVSLQFDLSDEHRNGDVTGGKPSSSDRSDVDVEAKLMDSTAVVGAKPAEHASPLAESDDEEHATDGEDYDEEEDDDGRPVVPFPDDETRSKRLKFLVGKMQQNLYQVEVLDRYPMRDHQDCAFPPGIPLFCVPEGGLRLSPSSDLPRYYDFACTVSSTDRLYGCVLMFHEEVDRSELEDLIERLYAEEFDVDDARAAKIDPEVAEGTARGQESKTNEPQGKCPTKKTHRPFKRPHSVLDGLTPAQFSMPVLWTSRCLCLLSHYPFLGEFRLLLTELYRFTLTPSRLPIERHIANFVDMTPLPPHGVLQVEYSIGMQRIVFARPPLNAPLQFSSVSPLILLQTLSVDVVITMLEALLFERRVLVLSNRLSVLAPVCESLLLLLYPFRWQHVYIPLLPKMLNGFLHAPMPFLIGAHTSVQAIIDAEAVDDLLVVFLDQNEHLSKADAPKLPPSKRARLAQELQELSDIFFNPPSRNRTTFGSGQGWAADADCAFFAPVPEDDELPLSSRWTGKGVKVPPHVTRACEVPKEILKNPTFMAYADEAMRRSFYRVFVSLFMQVKEYQTHPIDPPKLPNPLGPPLLRLGAELPPAGRVALPAPEARAAAALAVSRARALALSQRPGVPTYGSEHVLIAAALASSFPFTSPANKTVAALELVPPALRSPSSWKHYARFAAGVPYLPQQHRQYLLAAARRSSKHTRTDSIDDREESNSPIGAVATSPPASSARTSIVQQLWPWPWPWSESAKRPSTSVSSSALSYAHGTGGVSALNSPYHVAGKHDSSKQIDETSDSFFDEKGFLSNAKSENVPTLRAFCQTQAFQRFVDERTYAGLALEVNHHVQYFHESTIQKENRAPSFWRKTATPFLLAKDGEYKGTIIVPGPLPDIYPEDVIGSQNQEELKSPRAQRLYSYTRFPRFNPDLFWPRDFTVRDGDQTQSHKLTLEGSPSSGAPLHAIREDNESIATPESQQRSISDGQQTENKHAVRSSRESAKQCESGSEEEDNEEDLPASARTFAAMIPDSCNEIPSYPTKVYTFSSFPSAQTDIPQRSGNVLLNVPSVDDATPASLAAKFNKIFKFLDGVAPFLDGPEMPRRGKALNMPGLAMLEPLISKETAQAAADVASMSRMGVIVPAALTMIPEDTPGPAATTAVVTGLSTDGLPSPPGLTGQPPILMNQPLQFFAAPARILGSPPATQSPPHDGRRPASIPAPNPSTPAPPPASPASTHPLHAANVGVTPPAVPSRKATTVSSSGVHPTPPPLPNRNLIHPLVEIQEPKPSQTALSTNQGTASSSSSDGGHSSPESHAYADSSLHSIPPIYDNRYVFDLWLRFYIALSPVKGFQFDYDLTKIHSSTFIANEGATDRLLSENASRKDKKDKKDKKDRKDKKDKKDKKDQSGEQSERKDDISQDRSSFSLSRNSLNGRASVGPSTPMKGTSSYPYLSSFTDIVLYMCDKGYSCNPDILPWLAALLARGLDPATGSQVLKCMQSGGSGGSSGSSSESKQKECVGHIESLPQPAVVQHTADYFDSCVQELERLLPGITVSFQNRCPSPTCGATVSEMDIRAAWKEPTSEELNANEVASDALQVSCRACGRKFTPVLSILHEGQGHDSVHGSSSAAASIAYFTESQDVASLLLPQSNGDSTNDSHATPGSPRLAAFVTYLPPWVLLKQLSALLNQQKNESEFILSAEFRNRHADLFWNFFWHAIASTLPLQFYVQPLIAFALQSQAKVSGSQRHPTVTMSASSTSATSGSVLASYHQDHEAEETTALLGTQIEPLNASDDAATATAQAESLDQGE